MDFPNNYELNERLNAFEQWTTQNVMSAQSRRVYKSRLRSFFAVLDETGFDKRGLFDNQEARRNAIDCYKNSVRSYLKAATINGVMSTVNLFFEFNGVQAVPVDREFCSSISHKTLTREDQNRLLEVLHKNCRKQDRAMVLLLLSTGIKISECAGLNLGDILLSGNTVSLKIFGSGSIDSASLCKTKTVVVPNTVVRILADWIARRELDKNHYAPALFLNRQGLRMSTASIDMVVRRVGWASGLVLSAEMLRRTYFMSNTITSQSNFASLPALQSHDESLFATRYQTELSGLRDHYTS